MANVFPNMGNPDFPRNDGNVFAYENNFDYTRWQPNVKLKLCNVAWCSSYENVPWFETSQNRDEWFDSIGGRQIELTSETHLLPDGRVKVPLPFDAASMYNYLVVEFPPPTSIEKPLAYDDPPRRLRWHYFIDNVRSIAGNTTELVLSRDEWTTFYNDCTISYMLLERGHYPVAMIDAETFLLNPIQRNDLLLAPDVSYSEPRNVASASHLVINDGDMYACIATTADPRKEWGAFADADVPSGSPKVPSRSMYNVQGVLAPFVFAVHAENLSSFLDNVESDAPQFSQTVQGIFFAPEKLLQFGEKFSFCDMACWPLQTAQASLDLIDLDKKMFDYPVEYRNLAKLYTSPYAHIEISSENGLIAIVNVEDTSGLINVNAWLSLAWPSIGIDAVLSGINGKASIVDFVNIDEQTFAAGGDWYKTVTRWNVPTFAIVQNGGDAYDVGSYYNRVQAGSTASTIYTNAVASAKVSTDNIDLQVAANETMVEQSNSTSASDTNYANLLSQALQAWDAGYSRSCVAADNDAETQQAALSIGNTAISTIGSIAGSLATADIAGAVSAGISGVAAGATTAASTAISINLASSKTESAISNTQAHVDATSRNNTERNTLATACATNNANTQNDCNIAMTANAVNTSNANAERNRSIAYGAISNGRKQGGISAPTLNGNQAPGFAATRPMMMSANVVTQPKGAIKQAGDYFLRYGYALNQQVDASNLSLMPHYTYWHASDCWCVGTNGVPETAQETIKAIFLQGVTVWDNPTEIGKVSIYDNQ